MIRCNIAQSNLDYIIIYRLFISSGFRTYFVTVPITMNLNSAGKNLERVSYYVLL